MLCGFDKKYCGWKKQDAVVTSTRRTGAQNPWTAPGYGHGRTARGIPVGDEDNGVGYESGNMFGYQQSH
jgi:hypothetical protein